MWNIKSSSKLCEERRIIQDQLTMTNHVRTMKSMVDSKPPKRYKHLKFNVKRAEMVREQQKDIHR